ncbi:MAG: hypothetical protein ACTJHZ_08695 [Vagococcus sp.]
MKKKSILSIILIAMCLLLIPSAIVSAAPRGNGGGRGQNHVSQTTHPVRKRDNSCANPEKRQQNKSTNQANRKSQNNKTDRRDEHNRKATCTNECWRQ